MPVVPPPALPRSVLVVGDERKGGIETDIRAFAAWLETRVEKVHVVMDRQRSLEDIEADLVVVCGGDGSMLGAARRMGRNQRPTVGINLGRLGFLTAFGHDRAHDALEHALTGRLTLEPRPLLECRVLRSADGVDHATEPVLCVNDGVLSRPASAGITTVQARRHGHEVATFSGDGVIVATPTGSTAYSLAAGGPIIYPGVDALVLTPLASHMLTARSLVVPIDGGLELVVRECVEDCVLSIDGQVNLPVGLGDRVEFRRAEAEFLHLTRGPAAFYRVLRQKFGWAVTPRERVRTLGTDDSP